MLKEQNSVIGDPANPGYITSMIASIQRKRMRKLEEIHRLQGEVSGYDAVLRQITHDTEAALGIAQASPVIKEHKEAIKKGTEDFEKYDKGKPQVPINSLEGVDVRPKSSKKKGPSIIGQLAPPIEDEKPAKKKRKRKKKE